MLSSYPDVYNTCLVILERKGFALTYDKTNDSWVASILNFEFRGDNPIELLGLASIHEHLSPSADTEYWWKIDTPDVLGRLDPE